jgi:hypothetical protein
MSNFWTTDLTTDTTLGVFELANSVTENYDPEKGISAVATVLCPWDNREQVVSVILLNRLPYPRLPLAGALARTASVRPLESQNLADGSLHNPELAQITINYNQLDATDSTDPENIQIFSESLEPSAEFQTLDYRKFRWGSSSGKPLTAEQAPGKLVIGMDYVQTRYNVDEIPAIVLQPGQVNNAAITAQLLGLTFPVETLLYQNTQPSRTISTTGDNLWTMASRFSYRPNGWNKFWNEGKTGGAGWDVIYAKDNAGAWHEYKNFPPGDLSTILV